MIVAESPDYLAACVNAAKEALDAFFVDVGMALDEDILILPSQSPAGFPAALREKLDLPVQSVVDTTDEPGPAHTAGPLVALDKAMQDGRFEKAKRVVFVTVTPGIVVSIALYEQ